MNRVLAWGLRTWAAVQVLVAGLWIVGPYGANVLSGSQIPGGPTGLFGETLLDGLFTGPTIGAFLTEPGVNDRFIELSQDLSGSQGDVVTGAFGDINVGWSVQFSVLTTPQSFGWVALHVVPLLAMALLWWTLARVVAESRRETTFTKTNARRLSAAGLVVLVGAPAISVLTWWFYNVVADSSQIVDRIQVPGYSWADLPWTAMAAGFALLVLGQVWRRGVTVEKELGGLV